MLRARAVRSISAISRVPIPRACTSGATKTERDPFDDRAVIVHRVGLAHGTQDDRADLVSVIVTRRTDGAFHGGSSGNRMPSKA